MSMKYKIIGVISMDMRVRRTESSIKNAFIELRTKKDIEKITVKELCERAYINKATFYQHYKDIYELSERLEQEAIVSAVNSLERPEELITNPRHSFDVLSVSMVHQSGLFKILFSGTRKYRMSLLLEKELKRAILQKFPEYEGDLEVEILMTVVIQGIFTTSIRYLDNDFNRVIDILGDINETLINAFKEKRSNRDT